MTSALSKLLLKLLGWRLLEPADRPEKAVVIAYPHTSNWDFVISMLAKWGMGIELTFWGKDSLFRVPVLGGWLRMLGGVPVHRTTAHGVVGQTADLLQQAHAHNAYCWLAVAPEGTRKYIPGWRSGFYRTALRAGVPLGLVRLDYRLREVTVLDFLQLTGREIEDWRRIAHVYEGVTGCRPSQAAPIRLLDAQVPRSETIVK